MVKSHDIIQCFMKVNFQGNRYNCSVFIFLEQNLRLLNLYNSLFYPTLTLPFLYFFCCFLIFLLWSSNPTIHPSPSSSTAGDLTPSQPRRKWAVWVLCVSSRRISCPHGDHFTPQHNTVLISSETNKLQCRDSTHRPRSPLSNAACLDQCGLITSSSNNTLSLASFSPLKLAFFTNSHDTNRYCSFSNGSSAVGHVYNQAATVRLTLYCCL